MAQTLDGMADIIPPIPAYDGLAAVLAPGSSALGWGPFAMLIAALFIASLLLTAFLLRRRLLARWHLWQAERALHGARPASHIAARIEHGLRHHHHLNILHPGQAPYGMDTAAWRNLIERLHAARFGQQTLETDELRALLKPCFAPSTPGQRGIQNNEASS
ncbi:MAG: hypothetical protein AB1717_01420 [Pseudomonadota bacterium]